MVSTYNAVEAHLTSWFIARYGVAELELGGSPVRNCIIRHQGHTYRSLVTDRRVQSQSLVSFPLPVHRTLPQSLFSSLQRTTVGPYLCEPWASAVQPVLEPSGKYALSFPPPSSILPLGLLRPRQPGKSISLPCASIVNGRYRYMDDLLRLLAGSTSHVDHGWPRYCTPIRVDNLCPFLASHPDQTRDKYNGRSTDKIRTKMPRDRPCRCAVEQNGRPKASISSDVGASSVFLRQHEL